MSRNALQEMKPTPRNALLGLFSDGLRASRDFADKAQIPQGVPLIGGQGVGSLFVGKAPEELNEWSYGNAPMRINPNAGSTASYVPEMKPGRGGQFADVLFAAQVPGGKNALAMGMGAMDTGAARAAIDVGALKAKFPSVDFWLSQSGNRATLDKVVVPAEARGQGIGSGFMRALAEAADADAARLGLSPSNAFGGSKGRLEDFYKRFGFVPNKGGNRDFEVMQSMVRQPSQPARVAGDLPYQIDHKPMTKAGGAATLDDLAPAFGEDIYGKNALQFFGSGDARERSIVRTLAALRGKPDAPVTIYRGVPSDAKGINAGDWVTIDPKVAADYAAQHPGGRVVSMQVPASHVTSWADSLLEFGYHPPK